MSDIWEDSGLSLPPSYVFEVRQLEPHDLTSLIGIEVKSQSFPYSKEYLKELTTEDSVHGILLLYGYMPAGFCLFRIKESGALIDICRLSLMPHVLNKGGLRKIVEQLTVKIGDLPSPRLQIVISETELESEFFDALRTEGFVGIGLVREAYYQYGAVYDGIKLGRS